jgi:hypothetical protein
MKNQKGKQANKKPKIEKPNVESEPQKIITLEDMIPRLMKNPAWVKLLCAKY